MALQQTLNAVCDPVRREILRLLKKDSRTSGEICERFDISAPAISRHLGILHSAGLVNTTREGKFIRYSFNEDSLEELVDWIKKLQEEE